MPAKSGKTDTPQRQSDIVGLPEDVAAIRAEIRAFFTTKDSDGKRIGSYKHGVYAFYDYDGEPIYVGRTEEKLSGRISRHLTNQRTDAVAMNVLDPFEVAYIEVWPLDNFSGKVPRTGMKALLDQAEYTVFQKVLRESTLGAVLNEKEMVSKSEIKFPELAVFPKISLNVDCNSFNPFVLKFPTSPFCSLFHSIFLPNTLK